MYMFHSKDPKERRYITRAHLAEMIALLGTSLYELLHKGKRTAEYFDENGESFPARTTLSANSVD